MFGIRLHQRAMYVQNHRRRAILHLHFYPILITIHEDKAPKLVLVRFRI